MQLKQHLLCISQKLLTLLLNIFYSYQDYFQDPYLHEFLEHIYINLTLEGAHAILSHFLAQKSHQESQLYPIDHDKYVKNQLKVQQY